MSFVTRLTLAMATFAVAAFCADIAGNWKMSADGPDGNTYKFTLGVVRDGDSLKGTVTNLQSGAVELKDVAFSGSTLTFKLPYGEVGLIDFKLNMDGDALKGQLKIPSGETGAVTGTRDGGSAAPAGAVNVTGKWTITIGEIKAVMDLKQTGNKVTGEIAADQGTGSVDGKVEGDEFSFSILEAPAFGGKGKVNGAEIKGDFTTQDGTRPFIAKKN